MLKSLEFLKKRKAVVENAKEDYPDPSFADIEPAVKLELDMMDADTELITILSN